tara:strand:+ start:3380 stop:3562 length:183 start_codon:yes stop_codon:yes gene_type:complete
MTAVPAANGVALRSPRWQTIRRMSQAVYRLEVGSAAEVTSPPVPVWVQRLSSAIAIPLSP